MAECYIKIYPMPEKSSLLLVSNEDEAMNAALDLLKGNPEVQSIDAIPNIGADYIAPSNVSETNATPYHEIFKYNVQVHDGVRLSELATKLANNVQLRYEKARCEVIIAAASV
jgi:hypothetical protein